jgi:hypothetical protein
VAKLSQALGLDETAVGLPSRIDQSTGRRSSKALGRTTPDEDCNSGDGNLGQRTGEVRADERLVIGRENCAPHFRGDRAASHTASLT